MNKEGRLKAFAWGLSLLALAIAFVAWGETYSWKFATITSYKLFPLFGLVAFSLMWAHYIVGAVRRYFGVGKKAMQSYFDRTGIIVLFAILLHPGLLWWQLWRDGEGLPPGSVFAAVPDSLKMSVIMGMIALVIFLLFEFRRFFADKKWWKLIDYASILGMVIIFVHALRLGGAFDSRWFGLVWLYYGISLAMAVIYTFWFDYRHPKPVSEQ